MATPWQEADYLALDFESTGLNTRVDEVIQVGMVPIAAGAIHLGGVWASWVQPGHDVSISSARVHGLSRTRLAEAPTPADVRGPVADALRGRVLLAHYAELELGMLKRWKIKPKLVVDTLTLSLALDGATPDTARAEGYRLPALANRFDVDVYGEHDALADALITAEVFLVLAHQLAAAGKARSLQDLVRLSGHGRGGFSLLG